MSASALWRLDYGLLALHAAGAVSGWFSLPARVPIQFGFRGLPDAWAVTSIFSWFGLLAVSAGLSWFIRALTMHGPLEFWNIPEKQRFLRLSPEQQAPILDRMRAFGAASAICATIIFLALQIGIYQTARGATSLPAYVQLVMYGTILALLIALVPWSRSVRTAILRATGSD